MKDGIEEIHIRRQTLTSEHEEAKKLQTGDELAKLNDVLQQKQNLLDKARQQHQAAINNAKKCQSEINQLNEDITESRTAQQKLEGTLATLVSVQKGTSNTDSNEVDTWLSDVGIKNIQRYEIF